MPNELEQHAGEPLDRTEGECRALRRLYASGRYRDISVRGVRGGGTADSLTLIFCGAPEVSTSGECRYSGSRKTGWHRWRSMARKLDPGTAFTAASPFRRATDGIKQSLASNGYYQSTGVTVSYDNWTTSGQQVNVTYLVDLGPQARIGERLGRRRRILGSRSAEFRKKAKLKHKSSKIIAGYDEQCARPVEHSSIRRRIGSRLRCRCRSRHTIPPGRKQLDYRLSWRARVRS